MKIFRIAILASILLIIASTAATAGDFDWIKDFNIRAEADPSGFRAKLATRFQIGNAQISAVLGNVREPADAYMVLRLGEMSQHPTEKVLNEYKTNKGKGWGVMAKQLGIKPGSKEFLTLKKNHDFDKGAGKGKKKPRGKDKGKSRG